jgi:lipoprotein-releasing system permease protein
VEGLWALLSGAGGTLALGFIIVVAAGIAAKTLLFMGSAVVVLERFARVAKSWAWIAVFAVAVALGCAAILLDVGAPELGARPWKEWLEPFAEKVAACALIAAVAVLVCRLLVWRLSSARLGRVVLALLGLVVGLFVVSAALPEMQADLARLGVYVLWVLFAFVIFGLLPLAAAGLVEMRRSVEWFIAARYLVAKRRQVFISAITAICVGGIAAGVWLIIIVLSVMNGFEATWRNEILGNRAHFTVHNGYGPFPEYERVLEKVGSVPEVVAVSPYIDVDGMVRGRAGEIFSVRVRGIDPSSVDGVTDLRSDLILGSLDALVVSGAAAGSPLEQDEREENDGDPGIVIGNQLALSVGAAVGDSLLLISPFGGPPTPLGPAPRLKRFHVVGVFESSFFQYDEVYTYVSIPAAQEFRRSGPVIDGIEARTTDYYRSKRVGQAVEEVLGSPFYTRDWKEFFPAFFQALKTERAMMFMLLTMIMVVAAFLIVATLIMMIMEKSSDIAILKAMGAEDATIERVFAIEGTLIGLVGTVLGVISGIAVTRQLAWIQERIEAVTGIDTLPASVYQFSTLPSEVDPTQIALVATIAMVLSLGATLLPSWQGAKVDPAEGLRYE